MLRWYRLAICCSEAQTRRSPPEGGLRTANSSGDDLLSQGFSAQVPSALAGLTSVFGMGTGVTPPLWPPETMLDCGRPSRHDDLPCERSIASTSVHCSKPSAD